MNGLLGKKLGMTQIFDEAGNILPVTVVQAGPCVVTQVKTAEKDGYSAIQVGFGEIEDKKMNKPMRGHLKELKLGSLQEFKVSKPEEYKVGQTFNVNLFKAGDIVNMMGMTVGKGFQGTVKRWHHHRGPMSHGSKSHRRPGSIGSGTTPGYVKKGRRMAGHMGAVQATVKAVKIVRIDEARNLLMLMGSVPGKEGNLVRIVKHG